MRYPITPQYVKDAPNAIGRLYSRLEAWILWDICSRFKLADGATSTALEQIRLLRSRGYDYKDIERYVKRTLKLSDKEFEKIMQDAIAKNQKYYGEILTASGLTHSIFHAPALVREVKAIISHAGDMLHNITRSLGFSVKVNGKVTFLPIAKAYQQVLSDAEIRVWSGAQSPNEAIREATRQLAESGIQTVTWAEDGKTYHTDKPDVAARRAVMTGVTQLSSAYSEEIRKEVPTEYMEITAHRGARNITRKGRPWTNHKAWQGKVYSTDGTGGYPNVYTVCGWKQVDGLEGANCRHLHYPFWPGISERTYKDEELEKIDPPPITYKGKEYDAYAATQYQRYLEREMRKSKREMLGFEASGDMEAYKHAAMRWQYLDSTYKDFSSVAGLPMTERGNIAEFGPQDAKMARQILGK